LLADRSGNHVLPPMEQSILRPSMRKGGKRLYSSHYLHGAYQQAQPLSFSDGSTLDVDPEIAPDGSFLVFCSAGRLPDDKKDHLLLCTEQKTGGDRVVAIRYAGDDVNGYSTDDEPHLGAGHRTLYFSSDRSAPAHLPRSHEQAQRDFEHMESWGYFTDYTNAWSISLAPGWTTIPTIMEKATLGISPRRHRST
jgi:hypothetical protein